MIESGRLKTLLRGEGVGKKWTKNNDPRRYLQIQGPCQTVRAPVCLKGALWLGGVGIPVGCMPEWPSIRGWGNLVEVKKRGEKDRGRQRQIKICQSRELLCRGGGGAEGTEAGARVVAKRKKAGKASWLIMKVILVQPGLWGRISRLCCWTFFFVGRTFFL